MIRIIQVLKIILLILIIVPAAFITLIYYHGYDSSINKELTVDFKSIEKLDSYELLPITSANEAIRIALGNQEIKNALLKINENEIIQKAGFVVIATNKDYKKSNKKVWEIMFKTKVIPSFSCKINVNEDRTIKITQECRFNK